MKLVIIQCPELALGEVKALVEASYLFVELWFLLENTLFCPSLSYASPYSDARIPATACAAVGLRREVLCAYDYPSYLVVLN